MSIKIFHPFFHLGFFFVMSASIAVLRCGMPPNKQLLYPQLHCSSGVVAKNPPASVGDMGSISRLGRSSGGGNGNPLQYSCLENSLARGAWRATVYGVAKSQTQLSTYHYHKIVSIIVCAAVFISLGYLPRSGIAGSYANQVVKW